MARADLPEKLPDHMTQVRFTKAPPLFGGRFELAELGVVMEEGRELLIYPPFPHYGFKVICYADEDLVEFGEGAFALPRSFYFVFRDWREMVMITAHFVVADRELAMNQLHVYRLADGPAITTQLVRSISPGALIQFASPRAAMRRVDDEDGRTSWEIGVGAMLSKETTEEWFSAYGGERATPTSRRGVKLTDELLERVASVYRDAVLQHLPPTRAVEKTLYVSRSTAGRYVMEARRRGLLGPSVGAGRTGEREAAAPTPKRRTRKTTRQEATPPTTKPQPRRRKNG